MTLIMALLGTVNDTKNDTAWHYKTLKLALLMALQMALLGPANDTKNGTANGTANDTATINMIHLL
jgi:hypothetical protein